MCYMTQNFFINLFLTLCFDFQRQKIQQLEDVLIWLRGVLALLCGPEAPPAASPAISVSSNDDDELQWSPLSIGELEVSSSSSSNYNNNINKNKKSVCHLNLYAWI